MAIIRKRHIKGINLDPTDLSVEDLSNAGDLAYDSSDGKLKYKDSTNTRELLNTDESQTLSNKTLDNTSTVNYDNTTSGLAATTVKDALDELKVALEAQNEANEIDYTIKTGTGDNWNAFVDDDVTKVDLALDELASRVTIDEQALSNHIIASNAHLAQNIRLAPFINIGGDLKENVYTALTGLNAELALKALADGGTITNATIQTSSIEDSSLITSSIETPSRLDVKQDTEDNLETYAAGFTPPEEGNGQIVFATDTKKMFQIIDGALQPIGGGGSTQFEVTQANHGFVVGNGIYHNSVSNVWKEATADSADTLASYVVVEVVDANTFVAADFGRLEVNLLDNPNSLSAGEFYYLSDSVAGQPTTTESSLYSNPLFYVESIDATDPNNQLAVLQVKVYRPEQVEADEIISLVAAETVAIRDALYVDSNGQVGPLNADDDNKVEFIGFAKTSAAIGESVLVATSGKLSGFTGLTPGDFVYVNTATPGQLTQVEPSADGVYIVIAGKAISATEILINPDLGVSTEFNTGAVEAITIDNNVSTPTNISGLVFDGATYQSVVLTYSIYRKSDDTAEEKSQVGQLRLTYKTQNSSWSISDDFSGEDAGVDFSVTSSGQVQYVSSNFTGANYSGSFKSKISEIFEV